MARELLSEVYAAPNLPTARRRLVVFFQHAADTDVPELTQLARTIDRWRNEILAYHHTGGASNGPTEAVNLLIEKIRRIGHGYRNFDTTDDDYCSAAAFNGLPSPPAESEAANQPSPRRARLPSDWHQFAM